MTNITELAAELKEIVSWQRTPEVLVTEDYEKLIIFGIKTLYIDTGRAARYSKDMIIRVQEEEEEVVYFKEDLPIDEEKYVFLIAQIGFFKRVQSDVNNIVGYTTDALTITNADKPYANLQDTIMNLENERRIVFYKMTSYSFYQ